MLSYHLGTVNDFHWKFKPVLSYSNLTLSQHFLRRQRKEKCIYSLQPGHLEAEQNDRKVKRSKIKQKCVKKREFQVQTSSACENHHRSVPEWPMLEN